MSSAIAWLQTSFQQVRQRARAARVERWLTLLIGLGALVLATGIWGGWVHLYGGDYGDGSNRLYLLSAIAQTLGAILALAITATLVATQLAAQSFTPRVITYRLRDWWLWAAVALYLMAIGASLAAMAHVKSARAHCVWNSLSVEFCLLLSAMALAFLVPFIIAVLRSLETESFLRYLLGRGEYIGLEDFMRRSVNEGLVRQLGRAVSLLQEHAVMELHHRKGAQEVARTFADLGLQLGRYAAAKRDPEAIVVAMTFLTRMTTHCTGKVYRLAADIFNESVVELQRIAEEAFGS